MYLFIMFICFMFGLGIGMIWMHNVCNKTADRVWGKYPTYGNFYTKPQTKSSTKDFKPPKPATAKR